MSLLLALCGSSHGQDDASANKDIKNQIQAARKQLDAVRYSDRLDETIAILKKIEGLEDSQGDKQQVCELQLTLAIFHELQGQEAESLAVLQKAIKSAESVGKEHWLTRDVQVSYERAQRVFKLPQADKKALRDAMKIVQTVLPVLSDRDPKKALALGKEALAAQARILGPEHDDCALTLLHLSRPAWVLGDLKSAREFAQRSLAIGLKSKKGNCPDLAARHLRLASIYKAQGNIAQALSSYEKSAAIYRAVGANKDPYFGQVMKTIALTYGRIGRNEDCVRCYREAIQVFEATLPEDDRNLVRARCNLGLILNLSKPRESMKLLRFGLKNLKNLDTDRANRELYNACDAAIATCLSTLQRHAEARDHLERVLARMRRENDREHTATCLHNLADIYASLGDLTKSIDYGEEAMALRAALYGPNSLATLTCRQNLATSYMLAGRFDEAEKNRVEVVNLYRKVAGGRHPGLVVALSDLAEVKIMQSAPEEALKHLEEALKLCESPIVPAGWRANTLGTMAHLKIQMKEPKVAEELLRKARKIVLQSAQGKSHEMEYNLANLLASTDRRDEASKIYQELFDKQLRWALQELPLQSDTEAMVSFEQLHTAMQLMLANKHAHNPQAALDAFSTTWDVRGIVTREMADRRRRARSDNSEIWTEYLTTKAKLSTLSNSVKKPDSRSLLELSKKKEQLERAMSRTVAGFDRSRELQDATAKQFLQELPAEVAIVEFVYVASKRYDDNGLNIEPRYQAIIVPAQAAKRDGKPRPLTWLDLGPAEELDQKVAAFRRQHRMASDRGLKITPAAGVESAMAGPWLRKNVWLPIQKHLGECTTLVIVPDRSLWRLPWGALPGDKPETFLLETGPAFVTAANSRAIMATLQRDKPQGERFVACGDVEFDAKHAAGLPKKLAQLQRGLRSGDRPKVDKLPGSGREVREIAKLRTDLVTTLLLGKNATEANLRTALPSARFVHLATHGFFGRPGDRPLQAPANRFATLNPKSYLTFRNPLILSGLACSGVNTPPIRDEQGIRQSDDGLLTAEEVIDLNLEKTELVVLSSCDTGLSVMPQPGAGLPGLQSAFLNAGARSSIATLWQIDDAATKELMVRFYANLWGKKMSKAESLRQAQLAMLRGELATPEIRKKHSLKPNQVRIPPRYWAAWTIQGDWR